MNDDDIAWLDMAQTARLIHTRQLSAVEVTQALLRRIERLDGALMAFVRTTPELAFAQAGCTGPKRLPPVETSPRRPLIARPTRY